MRCHYTYDKKAGKVHIPGCWGAVIHGPGFCSCYDNSDYPDIESEKVKSLRREVKDLEKYNASLQRIIKQLIKTRNVK